MEDNYSVLIKSSTTDADVTLYIYSVHDPLCWLSYKSKIIPPGYLYREKDCKFKFNLKAIQKDGKKREILTVRKCKENKLFDVQESLGVNESDLSDHHHEKQICLRRRNMEEQLTSEGGRNLYELLKLDMAEVRKEKSTQKQNDMIKKAFHREIRRWHTDLNPETGDDHIAHEVIVAYDVLGDPEKRAQYNNMIDYDGGWLSKSRWRAIFWPECHTKQQKSVYRRRLVQMSLAVILIIGGITATVCTAGLAAPAAVIAGATIGSGLTGAGIQSGLRTVKRGSVQDGCDWKSFAKSAGLGFGSGAIAGGAAVGITAAVAGIGYAASEVANVSIGQYLAIGGATGAVGGPAASLSADLEKLLIDGENVTLKQFIGHAACGTLIGATAGAVGGILTKTFAASTTQASATNLELEAIEQGIIRTGGKRLGNLITQQVSRLAAEGGTAAITGAAAKFVEERLDDSVENRSPAEHLIESTKNLAVEVVKDCGKGVVVALGTHASKEVRSKGKVSTTSKQSKTKYNALDVSDIDIDIPEQEAHQDDDGRFLKWTDCRAPDKTYNANDNVYKRSNDKDEISKAQPIYSEEVQQSPGRIRYISQGDWRSRMIVKYELSGKLVNNITYGSGTSVEIPVGATSIKVNFQVLRFIATWCDVKKYDRFKKLWCQPTEAHVFRYQTPVERTFYIYGSLYYEAVMKITDGSYDELKDL